MGKSEIKSSEAGNTGELHRLYRVKSLHFRLDAELAERFLAILPPPGVGRRAAIERILLHLLSEHERGRGPWRKGGDGDA